MNKEEKEIISKYFEDMAKKTHKKHPRTKVKYREMQRLSVAKRKANKLSTT